MAPVQSVAGRPVSSEPVTCTRDLMACYQSGTEARRTSALRTLLSLMPLRPMAGTGRVCEVTSGRFGGAKQEKRWFAVRPLLSDPAGRFGSIAGPHDRLLTGTRRGGCRPRSQVARRWSRSRSELLTLMVR